jgi:hypothetical protein
MPVFAFDDVSLLMILWAFSATYLDAESRQRRWHMGKKLAAVLVSAIVGLVVFALPCHAQGGFLTGRGGGMHAQPHAPFRGVPRGGFLTGPRGRRPFRNFGTAVYPYFYPPYFYSDYYYPSQPAPQEQQPTSVVVVESTQPQAAAPPSPPPESLVLERQGDRWVRVTGSGQSETSAQPGQQAAGKTEGLRAVEPRQFAEAASAREVPPAVLVFRDGHQEQISRYTIVGGTIYASSDYWSNGSWTKKVPIAELNVPATLELNQQRGSNFTLPSSPSVVVVRP